MSADVLKDASSLDVAEIKTIRGFIPICVHCKGIRNETGYWERVESYLTAHTEAELTHTFCDRCAEQHYSEFFSPTE